MRTIIGRTFSQVTHMLPESTTDWYFIQWKDGTLSTIRPTNALYTTVRQAMSQCAVEEGKLYRRYYP